MVAFQLFEGEKKAVEFLWERIQADGRHTIRDTSIDETYPEKLLSSEWGMPLVDPAKMCEYLENVGVNTDSAKEAIAEGKPDTEKLSKLWAKWSKKWAKKQAKEAQAQKKMTKAELDEKLQAAKIKLKEAQAQKK